MAEAAAGVVAYEAVETVAQIGVGAYFLAKPTMPLKARITQISASKDNDTRLSLARSNHTLSVVGSKAYIWGGETASDQLAGTEMHAIAPEATEKLEPEYSIIPAMPKSEGGKLPAARTKHAACALGGDCVAISGGTDGSGSIIEEDSAIWLFNTAYQNWELIEPIVTAGASPPSRHSARLFQHRGNLILYGGQDAQGTLLKDTWHFDCTNKSWLQLASAPVASPNAALSEGTLHLISGTDSVSSDLHFLQLNIAMGKEQEWHTVPFPTSPLTPGPLPRLGAGLVPCSTGYGRQYLLYLFGAQPSTPSSLDSTKQPSPPENQTDPKTTTTAPATFWSDMWTYQLPSSDPELKPTTQIYEAMKPARIKDAIRSAIGVDSGKHSWAEVEVLPPMDLLVDAGKVHPGPRSAFACDAMKDRKGVVIWGGVNPKGEREGDGWIIRLE